MDTNLGELARLVGGELDGDPARPVTGVAGLDQAGPGDVSFLADVRYLADAGASRAAGVLVPRDFRGTVAAPVIRVDEPYTAFLLLLREVHRESVVPPAGVHPTAVVDPGAELHPSVGVGAHAVVEAGVRLGEGTVLWPGAFVGREAVLGRSCTLLPGARACWGVVLGDRVTLQAGSVVGTDGFGYVSRADGHHKIPHVGTVVLEDDVEIGANTAIDRGTLGTTRIGAGTKIDNLVHVAHNVTVGPRSLIAAQAGISGSTVIGSGVVIGGQAGLAGHIRIGDGARIAAQSGVTKSVDPGITVSGYPAQLHGRAKRLNGHLRKLPGLGERIRELEQRIRELERSKEGVS